MKRLFFLLNLSVCTLTMGAQTNNIEPFKLSVAIDHALMPFSEHKYILTERRLDIVPISFIVADDHKAGNERIVFSKQLLPSRALYVLSKMDLTPFDEFYDEPRILITSG